MDYTIHDVDFLTGNNVLLQEVRLVDMLVDMRRVYKERGDYKMSDMIRNRLTELGIIVKDTKEGVSWKYGQALAPKKIWDDIRQGWYFEKDMRDDISEEGLKRWQEQTVKKIKTWIQEEIKKK